MASGIVDAMSLEGTQLNTNLEDIICPICLDIPHNAVLLQCSSYKRGCRTFICDTDDSHSNCLDRYRHSHGLFASMKMRSTTTQTSSNSSQSFQVIPLSSDSNLTCPMCRGNVTRFILDDKVRSYLNMKKRCCDEQQCAYVGNYMELHQHAKQEHPDSRPSEVDPQRQQDWDNFQQFSEITDVLSTIHSEVPHGVVFGDYVIDYGDESGDEFEDFPGDDGNWWTSCILYQVFDNFRSREGQQLRNEDTRRIRPRSSYDGHMDDGSTSSTDISYHQFEGSDEEFGAADGGTASRGNHNQRRYSKLSADSMFSHV
ncbi:hypothetical protein Cni_G03724 [Canna indica]|uniref:Uncharacterized protein n=1 Tax=Canna indica TaxID=4628 RepID=A0AAQ3Q3R9_9LILI|nr:hypothetical protein Cni_G03724 [Canna indica]